MSFSYDWFHSIAFEQQKEEAAWRCVARNFPDLSRPKLEENAEAVSFRSELELRTLIYLRDGFRYEVKGIADVASKSHLVFECEPIDDHYKVGAFVVTLPFEEIVRVEVFAVHPNQKPDDLPQITGFRGYAEPAERKPPDLGGPGPGMLTELQQRSIGP